MPPLRDLQARVLAALSDPAAAAAAVHLVAGPQSSALARLDLYRDTLYGVFADAMLSVYPAVARLVGIDYFHRIVREYQRAYPSRSGDLNCAGEHFPQHLRRLHGTDRFAYLADVAQLEWLIQDVLLAPEHAPLDLQALARVAPADYGELRFMLHPASRLFASPFPALAIWDANVRTDATPEIIDLDAGADRLLAMRRHSRLEFLHLTRGEFACLDSLAGGAPFAQAVDAATSADAAFDATAALQRFVRAAAVVDLSSPGLRSPGAG